jgi:chitin synthase
MLAEPADVNDLYEEALRNLKGHKFANKAAKKAAGFTPMTNAEKEQRAKDYYANVRTNVLLLWVLSNVRSSLPYPGFFPLSLR